MRKKYCCDGVRDLYEQYYTQQSGTGLPIFSGSRGQRGHGLGSIIGGLFRSALPMLKRGLASFGKQALKTGLEMANDVVVDGQNWKSSAKRRVPAGIKSFAQRQGLISQSGRGRKRKISTKRKQIVKRRRHPSNDIFSY